MAFPTFFGESRRRYWAAEALIEFRRAGRGPLAPAARALLHLPERSGVSRIQAMTSMTAGCSYIELFRGQVKDASALLETLIAWLTREYQEWDDKVQCARLLLTPLGNLARLSRIDGNAQKSIAQFSLEQSLRESNRLGPLEVPTDVANAILAHPIHRFELEKMTKVDVARVIFATGEKERAIAYLREARANPSASHTLNLVCAESLLIMLLSSHRPQEALIELENDLWKGSPYAILCAEIYRIGALAIDGNQTDARAKASRVAHLFARATIHGRHDLRVIRLMLQAAYLNGLLGRPREAKLILEQVVAVHRAARDVPLLADALQGLRECSDGPNEEMKWEQRLTELLNSAGYAVVAKRFAVAFSERSEIVDACDELKGHLFDAMKEAA